MDINSRAIRNNFVWDSATSTHTINLAVAGGATAAATMPCNGKYCIISNIGSVNVYVGSDADGTPAASTAGEVNDGGMGVVVEPNASFEFAADNNAVIYVRNASATTAAVASVLWFK